MPSNNFAQTSSNFIFLFEVIFGLLEKSVKEKSNASHQFYDDFLRLILLLAQQMTKENVGQRKRKIIFLFSLFFVSFKRKQQHKQISHR